MSSDGGGKDLGGRKRRGHGFYPRELKPDNTLTQRKQCITWHLSKSGTARTSALPSFPLATQLKQ